MRRILFVLAFLMTACVPSGPTLDPTEIPKAVPQQVPTQMPTEVPVPEPTETFVPSSPPPRYYTAVLIGEDRDDQGWGARGDSFVIITMRVLPVGDSLEPSGITLLSIPRDTLVKVWGENGWTDDRVNSAFLRTGFEGVRKTVFENFGLEVNSGIYVLNFDQFIQVTDMLGGLTVIPNETYGDWCGNYKGLLNIGDRGGKEILWERGKAYHMDGAHLLCYVRARGFSDDVGRTRRAQDVLRAMKADWLPTIVASPTIWPDLYKVVRTNLRLPEIITMVPLANAVWHADIPMKAVGMTIGVEVKYGATKTGASVLVPTVDLKRWAICNVVSEQEAQAGGCP